EGTILSAIQSQSTNFDISASGLLQLKKNGISPKLMDAILGAARKQKEDAQELAAKEAASKAAAASSSSPSTQGASGQPSVLLVQDTQKQALVVGRTQIVQAKVKASTLTQVASDSSLQQALSGVAQTMAAAAMLKGPGLKMASTVMMANP